MIRKQSDVVVIGAGIAGLAQAWAATRAGRTVTILERSPYAHGASIRNFGMIWPIGQVPGSSLDAALRSRELWIEAADQAGFWHTTTGSIYLAVREDELQVMREFVDFSSTHAGYQCEMLTQAQAWDICPAANRANVIGGFCSSTEVGIDPREAIAKMPKLLAERFGVEVVFEAPVIACESGVVRLSDGRIFEAREQIVVCSGAETSLLYRGLLEASGAVPCKLQMFATQTQPGDWNVGPMIASGSTLRHYEAFAICPSLPALKRRFAKETPQLDKMGIHFMAAQNGVGEVVMGDSHEYGDEISPFDSAAIEGEMVKGLRTLLDLKDFTIARRWNGVYLKVPGRTHLLIEPEPGVLVFNGLGGAGMTLSFGLADRMWSASSLRGSPDSAELLG